MPMIRGCGMALLTPRARWYNYAWVDGWAEGRHARGSSRRPWRRYDFELSCPSASNPEAAPSVPTKSHYLLQLLVVALFRVHLDLQCVDVQELSALLWVFSAILLLAGPGGERGGKERVIDNLWEGWGCRGGGQGTQRQRDREGSGSSRRRSSRRGDHIFLALAHAEGMSPC